MSELKCTPGEWSLGPKHDPCGIYSESGELLGTAYVLVADDDTEDDERQGKANALLMWRSKRMYEKLAAILLAYENLGVHGDGPLHAELHGVCGLLAEARGETL